MTRAHGILGNASLDRWDALVVSTIVLGAAVLGWPVLAGGLGTYLDNPVHLAEVDSLIREGAWSDIAFAGFPLGILHSPLWYGALALAARAGLPVAGAYAGLLWLAACAPPLAVYGVGRSRAPRTVAIAAAFQKWWGGLGFGPRLLAELVWLGIYAAGVAKVPRVLVGAATLMVAGGPARAGAPRSARVGDPA